MNEHEPPETSTDYLWSLLAWVGQGLPGPPQPSRPDAVQAVASQGDVEKAYPMATQVAVLRKQLATCGETIQRLDDLTATDPIDNMSEIQTHAAELRDQADNMYVMAHDANIQTAACGASFWYEFDTGGEHLGYCFRPRGHLGRHGNELGTVPDDVLNDTRTLASVVTGVSRNLDQIAQRIEQRTAGGIAPDPTDRKEYDHLIDLLSTVAETTQKIADRAEDAAEYELHPDQLPKPQNSLEEAVAMVRARLDRAAAPETPTTQLGLL